jgi:hypothetical protein
MAGRLGSEFAVLAVLCAAAFFLLFPMAHGPYSVVHGPVTTLASIRARLMLWLGMALAALHLLRSFVLTLGFAARHTIANGVLLPSSFLPDEPTVLRC